MSLSKEFFINASISTLYRLEFHGFDERHVPMGRLFTKESAKATIEEYKEIEPDLTPVEMPYRFSCQVMGDCRGVHARIATFEQEEDGRTISSNAFLNSTELAELIRNLQEIQLEIEKAEFKELSNGIVQED